MESSKSTICKVDKRGGIFLPLSMRKAFDIAQNVRLEFSPQDDGTVVLKKLDSACFFCGEKFYRFSDYLGTTSQMSELLGISSISGILRFGRYPAYHGISEPHLAVKSSKSVVENRPYY